MSYAPIDKRQRMSDNFKKYPQYKNRKRLKIKASRKI